MPNNIPAELPIELVQLITPQQAWHYRIIPQSADEVQGLVFWGLSHGRDVISELELLFDRPVSISVASVEVVEAGLSKYYRRRLNGEKSTQTYSGRSEDFLSDLIREAKSINSSDIHVEAYEDRCRVRLRIDGSMVERFLIKKADYPAIVNKIKIMSNLDISEKRLPQDGRIFYSDASGKFDIRVSNRLQYVDDFANHGMAGLNDVTAQSTGNYGYDAAGNLIADADEGLSINWNAYGKVSFIRNSNKGTDIILGYDAAGNRIFKKE